MIVDIKFDTNTRVEVQLTRLGASVCNARADSLKEKLWMGPDAKEGYGVTVELWAWAAVFGEALTTISAEKLFKDGTVKLVVR